MTAHWSALALPFVILSAMLYVAYRLRFFSSSESVGRYFFWGGSALVMAATIWHAIATTPGYERWFVITAYRTFDLLEFGAVVAGILLIVTGIHRYAENQNRKREELNTLEAKLSIQENLHHEASGHYQLLELLNITLKELLVHFPNSAGAAFLINRGKRQLVLGAGVGFTKNETARLEQYPVGRNLITQAIEDGSPVIAGAFQFADEQGRGIESRFGSSLVIPLLSGGEKIGAVLLLTESPRAFGRLDVRYLSPVAQWLAERILAARLGRELSSIKAQLETASQESENIQGGIDSALQALLSSDPETSVCRTLIGIHDSTSVHVCSLVSNRLQISGTAGVSDEFSESLKIALIDAIERRKPLIINQESTDQQGRPIVVRSNLMIPIAPEPNPISLLLRKDGHPFEIGEKELTYLGLFGKIVRVALNQSAIVHRDINRRAGFETVIALLSGLREGNTPEQILGFFLKLIYDILPAGSIALAVKRRDDASFVATGSYGTESANSRQMSFDAGEGIVATVGASREPHFAVGKKSVQAALESFHPENRLLLHKLFDESQAPAFAAFCPVLQTDSLVGVAAFFLSKVSSEETAEWERLLSLAGSLYSLRLSVDHARISPQKSGGVSTVLFDTPHVVNDLNNHLSAVIGTAGLALRQEQLSGDMKTELSNIIAEAEHAAALLKSFTPVESIQHERPPSIQPKADILNSAIDLVLHSSRISGDLYMAGGRAREIVWRSDLIGEIGISSSVMREFFESVLNRFASASPEDDMITISTYKRDRYVYLDISRHRRNFPPVDHVASFGEYELTEQAVRTRPSDVFLSLLSSEMCSYSFDRVGSTPAYLSFRFPLKGESKTQPLRMQSGDASLSILAIDDQAVILDLISAMAQSMGHRISVARTGEEGVRTASAGHFDLVLTDLAMPDLSGIEVARRIHRKSPNTKIVLITGWDSGVDPSSLHASGISQVLNKPFRIEQLADIIRATAERLTL